MKIDVEQYMADHHSRSRRVADLRTLCAMLSPNRIRG
jgi:hypothetical protein